MPELLVGLRLSLALMPRSLLLTPSLLKHAIRSSSMVTCVEVAVLNFKEWCHAEGEVGGKIRWNAELERRHRWVFIPFEEIQVPILV